MESGSLEEYDGWREQVSTLSFTKNFKGMLEYVKEENFNIFNARSWQYSPENGLIVMFPAELWHRIEKNRSNTTRYSLAFNVMPVGQIGYSTHDSHCTINLL